MYGFIRGFQRCVWWPKCAPASSNCCMVTTLVAMIFSFRFCLDEAKSPAVRPAPVCTPRLWDGCARTGTGLRFQGDVCSSATAKILTTENKQGTLLRPNRLHRPDGTNRLH